MTTHLQSIAQIPAEGIKSTQSGTPNPSYVRNLGVGVANSAVAFAIALAGAGYGSSISEESGKGRPT